MQNKCFEDISESFMLCFSAFVTITLLGWVLWCSRYGFEFTDEGYYLMWISYPFKYKASITQFGFIYHPLYKLFKGNIVLLRQCNILITYSLSWILSYIFLLINFNNQILKTNYRIIIASAIALTALTSFNLDVRWLPPTPSYNTLALQALLIISIGLLMAEKEINFKSLVGWFLIGLGGWLAFMAKPTTAAGAGICTFFYLMLSKKINIKLVLFSLGTSVVFTAISALFIDGSILDFIYRIKDGIEMMNMMDSTHGKFMRLDIFYLHVLRKLLNLSFFITVLLVFFVIYFAQSKNKFLFHTSTSLSLVFGVISLIMVFSGRWWHKSFYVGRSQQFLMLSVPCTIMLIVFLLRSFKAFSEIFRPNHAVMFIFLIFPYIYPLGTTNNYLVYTTGVGIFYILVGFVFLNLIKHNTKFHKMLLSISYVIQIIIAIQVHNSMITPYRQPSNLWSNNYRYTINTVNSSYNVFISKGFARYIEEAVEIMYKAGFKLGDPMIDLTGLSPGFIYVTGGTSPGLPWLLASGGDSLAIKALEEVSCQELSRAWVLMEPDGKFSLSSKVLESFGVALSKDFKVVGTIKTDVDVAGLKKIRVQKILKPIKTFKEGVDVCLSKRKKQIN